MPLLSKHPAMKMHTNCSWSKTASKNLKQNVGGLDQEIMYIPNKE
jgi:hypothetical protein